MNQFRKKPKDTLHIELTPLIDMVFIILIFFMLSSSFLKPVLKLTLPIAETQDIIDKKDVITITVDASKNIFIDDELVDFADFERIMSERLSSIKSIKSPKVTLSADKAIDYGFFVQIMDILKKLNVKDLALEHNRE